MSELIITPKSIEEIKIYQNADCFLLGNESFCVRYNHSYSNEEIIEENTTNTILPTYNNWDEALEDW